jgi:hypothetical protein
MSVGTPLARFGQAIHTVPLGATAAVNLVQLGASAARWVKNATTTSRGGLI